MEKSIKISKLNNNHNSVTQIRGGNIPLAAMIGREGKGKQEANIATPLPVRAGGRAEEEQFPFKCLNQHRMRCSPPAPIGALSVQGHGYLAACTLL